MSDTLKPKPVESSEPFAQRWGLWGGGCLLVPIGTSISESGVGGCAQLGLDIAESFDERYTLAFQFDYAKTKAKLLPSTFSEGTTTDREHYGALLGLGKTKRLAPLYGKDRSLAGALDFGVTPLLGIGSTTIGGGSRELEGDTFAFGSSNEKTFDIKTNYSLLGEFRPLGRGPTITFGPEFAYGVQYAGEGSEFNRVGLEFGFTLRLGYGDASTLSGGDIDTPLGAMGIVQGFWSILHGYMQRYAMSQTLANAQEALADYGLSTSGSGERGSMANVPLLESAAAFAGALGGPSTALRLDPGWYWAFVAAQAAGGAFLASEGNAGKASAVSDLLATARLLGFIGIENPEKRLALSSEEIRRREIYINLASFALNTAFALGGGLGGSDIVATAGAGANLNVAFSPDPAGRGLAESTQASIVPVSYSSGSAGSGLRSGLRIHQSWRDFPLPEFQLFSQILFLSPMIRADNLANDATEDKPFGNAGLTSDIDATLGLEWRTRWTRLYFGLDTKGIYGGNEQTVGIGGVVGFDVTIPVGKRWAITLGAMGMAHKTFPKGTQYEFVPSLGVELFDF